MNIISISLGLLMIWLLVATVGLGVRCARPKEWGFAVCLQLGGYAAFCVTIGIFIAWVDTPTLDTTLRCDELAAASGQKCMSDLMLLLFCVIVASELCYVIAYAGSDFSLKVACPAWGLASIFVAALMGSSNSPADLVSLLIATVFMFSSTCVTLFEYCTRTTEVQRM